MLNQKETVEAAKVFLSKQLELDPASIEANRDLKSIGLDSFRIIELVLFLERKTGVAFPDHAYTPENLKSVDSIVSCLMKL
ncbi:MAG: phosphopantetheine-binding protein [Bacteroidota bacterium]